MRFAGLALLACMAVGCSGKSDKIELTARELNPDLKPTPLIEDVIDEAELGLPVYPGAKTPKGMPPMVRSSVQDFESQLQLATVEVWLESGDSTAEVAAFYRPRLSGAQLTTTATGISLEGISPKGEKCRVLANRKTDSKITTISVMAIKNVAGVKPSPPKSP